MTLEKIEEHEERINKLEERLQKLEFYVSQVLEHQHGAKGELLVKLG